MQKKNSGKAGVAKPISLQALEQRYLLDAAAVSTLADAATDTAPDTDLSEAIQQLPEFAGVSNSDQRSESETPDFLDVGPLPQTNELVFIDKGVSNVEELITGISPTASVYFIDTATDGVEQVTEILANYSDVDAIHIISHGEQGSLRLGSSVLNTDSMSDEYATCLLYTSPSPRDKRQSRMPSSA